MILADHSTESLVKWMTGPGALRRRLGTEVSEAWGTPRQWQALRAIYREITPDLLAGHCISPYFVDWLPIFTPIEEDLWFSIRALGLPFFPQYPVGRFFVDFADPVRKIAIECDGKQWHDAAKDTKRDADLQSLGWEVIRFPGWRCRLGEDDPESSHEEMRRLAGRYHGQENTRNE